VVDQVVIRPILNITGGQKFRQRPKRYSKCPIFVLLQLYYSTVGTYAQLGKFD